MLPSLDTLLHLDSSLRTHPASNRGVAVRSPVIVADATLSNTETMHASGATQVSSSSIEATESSAGLLKSSVRIILTDRTFRIAASVMPALVWSDYEVCLICVRYVPSRFW